MFSGRVLQNPRFAGVTDLRFKPVASGPVDSSLLSRLNRPGDKNALMKNIFCQAHKAGQEVDYFDTSVGNPENLRFNYSVVTNDRDNRWKFEMLGLAYTTIAFKMLEQKTGELLKIFESAGKDSLESAQKLISNKFFPAFTEAMSTSHDLTAWLKLKEGLQHIADIPKTQDISPYTLAIKGLFQELLEQKESILRQMDATRPIQYELTLEVKPSADNRPFKWDVGYKQEELGLAGTVKNLTLD